MSYEKDETKKKGKAYAHFGTADAAHAVANLDVLHFGLDPAAPHLLVEGDGPKLITFSGLPLPSSDDHKLTEHTALLTDLRTASEAWALCNDAVFR
mgnify:CR=1 FL=1